jgi:hypothetical protein
MEKDNVENQYSDSETDPATELSMGSDSGLHATHYMCKAGPIWQARKTVAFVCKSGQYCYELQAIIAQGNTDSIWWEITVGENTPVETTVNLCISHSIFLWLALYWRWLASVTVIADVKMHWDSVFYMLCHLRYLQQVCPNSVRNFISHVIISAYSSLFCNEPGHP